MNTQKGLSAQNTLACAQRASRQAGIASGALIGIILLLIVAGGAVYVITQNNGTLDIPDANDENAPFSVSGGTVGSRSVTVDSVVLEEDGFIVVERLGFGGGSRTIGTSSILKSGRHTNVTVELTEALPDNSRIVVHVVEDDGDGSYDADTDAVVEDTSVILSINAEEAEEETPAHMPEFTDTNTSDPGTTDSTGEPVQSEDETGSDDTVVDTFGATINYTDSGFTPSTVTITKGATVTWVNQSSRDVWPASAVHPTHTVYPGSDIQKCGTSGETGIFDSCGRVVPGGSWEFTFTEVGSWHYHDHLRASETGTIIVQ